MELESLSRKDRIRLRSIIGKHAVTWTETENGKSNQQDVQFKTSVEPTHSYTAVQRSSDNVFPKDEVTNPKLQADIDWTEWEHEFMLKRSSS